MLLGYLATRIQSPILAVFGFAPNWYFNPGDAGLAIYISPGSVNGIIYNGQLVSIPAQSTVTVWINIDGSAGVGSSPPSNSYSVATVQSGTVRVGGNLSTAFMLSFLKQQGYSPIYNVATADGILGIIDIRQR